MLPGLLFALVAGQVTSQSLTADVIVIGAGVAGLKAAADLKKANVNVVVLEARSRPYGRVDSQRPEGWPIAIELGAQWFHGDQRSNAVLQYAQTQLQPKPTIVSTLAGNDVSTFDTLKTTSSKLATTAEEGRWERSFTQFENYLGNRQESAALTASLETAIQEFLPRIATADVRGFLGQIDSNYVQEYAASPDKLSLAYFDSDSPILGPDSITLNYSSIFGAMVASLGPALKLDAAVTRIAKSGTGFQVFFTNPKTQATSSATAQYVVCTLPLGVLKAKYSTMFAAGVDTLQSTRTVAIDRLGMGLMNKAVLQFPTAFWREIVGNDQWIQNLPILNSAVQWNEFFSLHRATGQNILVAFQAGNSAIAAEGLSDADTVNSVMTTLRAMFGARTPEPVRFVITRWSQDPYALGAYSYHAAGAAGNARSVLCAKAGKLLFAGEACNLKYPGAVQGAWLSGEAAAKSILQALRAGRTGR